MQKESSWDARYSGKEYSYSEHPNKFLKDQLDHYPAGTILFPGEGEGRNAVYALKSGWTVTAFDLSAQAKKKALELAKKNNVVIDYKVGELYDLNFRKEQFDAIALIFMHFPSAERKTFHKDVLEYLRPGGLIILEAFSKDQIKFQEQFPKNSGPRNPDMLFTVEDIKADFNGCEIIQLEQLETNLVKSCNPDARSSVVRFLARKF